MKKILSIALSTFIISMLVLVQLSIQSLAVSVNEINDETSTELFAKNASTPRKYTIKSGYGVDAVCGICGIDGIATNGNTLYLQSIKNKSFCPIGKDPSDDEFRLESDQSIFDKAEFEFLLGKEKAKKVNKKTEISLSDFVYLNSKIYSIITFNFGNEIIRVLGEYSVDDINHYYEWVKTTELPKGFNSSMSTLGYYNEKLYIIGGYDESKKTISKTVYELDIKSKKWTKKANLPEGRFASKATQVGNELLLSFGGKEKGGVPSVLVYNGDTWKKSKVAIAIKDEPNKYNENEYYKVNAGLMENGLIFSGVETEIYGNVFSYNLKTDSYSKNEYSLKKGMKHAGISIKDKYYALEEVTNKDSSQYVVIYEIPIKTGFKKISVDYPKSVLHMDSEDVESEWEAVNGACCDSEKQDPNNIFKDQYYYMPGQTVTLKVFADEDYYVKSFKIDGKSINSNKYNGIILSDKKISIRADKVNKVIELEKSEVNMSVFDKKIKLKAKLKDKSCSKITWETVTREDWTWYDSNCVKLLTDGTVIPRNIKHDSKEVVAAVSKRKDGRRIEAYCHINIDRPYVKNLKTTGNTTSSMGFKWNKVKNCHGYEVRLYDDSDYHSLIKTYTTKKNSINIKNLKAGKVYYVKVYAYKNIENKRCYSCAGKVSYATKPKAPKLNKLTSKNKILTAKWNKVSGAKGYVVYRSSSKNGKYSKVATVKCGEKTSVKIKGLKKGKKYFVKVRTYNSFYDKKLCRKRLYSAFSNIKKIVIK